jgi:hypothetical protein
MSKPGLALSNRPLAHNRDDVKKMKVRLSNVIGC